MRTSTIPFDMLIWLGKVAALQVLEIKCSQQVSKTHTHFTLAKSEISLESLPTHEWSFHQFVSVHCAWK